MVWASDSGCSQVSDCDTFKNQYNICELAGYYISKWASAGEDVYSMKHNCVATDVIYGMFYNCNEQANAQPISLWSKCSYNYHSCINWCLMFVCAFLIYKVSCGVAQVHWCSQCDMQYVCVAAAKSKLWRTRLHVRSWCCWWCFSTVPASKDCGKVWSKSVH
jgi:hypothetical protein